uniref:Uncharacterized protein n=1 Tax=Ixodes ricinus TaxID=34613 RepID=A0A6B0UNV1_IXORI
MRWARFSPSGPHECSSALAACWKSCMALSYCPSLRYASARSHRALRSLGSSLRASLHVSRASRVSPALLWQWHMRPRTCCTSWGTSGSVRRAARHLSTHSEYCDCPIRSWMLRSCPASFLTFL